MSTLRRDGPKLTIMITRLNGLSSGPFNNEYSRLSASPLRPIEKIIWKPSRPLSGPVTSTDCKASINGVGAGNGILGPISNVRLIPDADAAANNLHPLRIGICIVLPGSLVISSGCMVLLSASQILQNCSGSPSVKCN